MVESGITVKIEPPDEDGAYDEDRKHINECESEHSPGDATNNRFLLQKDTSMKETDARQAIFTVTANQTQTFTSSNKTGSPETVQQFSETGQSPNAVTPTCTGDECETSPTKLTTTDILNEHKKSHRAQIKLEVETLDDSDADISVREFIGKSFNNNLDYVRVFSGKNDTQSTCKRRRSRQTPTLHQQNADSGKISTSASDTQDATSSMDIDSRMRHVFKSHKSGCSRKVWTCKVCQAKFQDRLFFNKHIATLKHFPGIAVTEMTQVSAEPCTVTRSFFCNMCPASYTHLDSLKRHKRHDCKGLQLKVSSHKSYTFPCLFCGKAFATNRQRNNHTADCKETENLNIEASIEEEESNDVHVLKTQNFNAESSLYVCTECSATFTHFDSYTLHQKQHESRLSGKPDADLRTEEGCNSTSPIECNSESIDLNVKKSSNNEKRTLVKSSVTSTSAVAGNTSRAKNRTSTKAEWTCFVCKMVFPERRILNNHVYSLGHFPAMMGNKRESQFASEPRTTCRKRALSNTGSTDTNVLHTVTSTELPPPPPLFQMGFLVSANTNTPPEASFNRSLISGQHLDSDQATSAGCLTKTTHMTDPCTEQCVPKITAEHQFPYKNSMEDDTYMCQFVSQFHCKICDKYFNTWENLTVHMSRHTSCPISIIKVKRDEDECDTPPTTGEFHLLYKCALCDEAFKTLEKYVTHMQTQHTLLS